MYFALFALLLFSLFFLLVFHWRKKKIIRKICSMQVCEKWNLLNELVNPLGYQYEPGQDIFSSTLDAWQKDYGYGEIYNQLSPHFNMIFDALPLYFNYDGKTWLIQCWKGQYGINTGGEVGIYCADSILPSEQWSTTIFHAVEDSEQLYMTFRLYQNNKLIASSAKTHWWLTAFCLGRFSHPDSLSMEISLRFPNFTMQDAFLDALVENGYNQDKIRICYNTIAFSFDCPKHSYGFFKNLYRRYVQGKNLLFCKLYCFVTKPFRTSCDKILYLYFYLPFAFRRTLRLHRYR